MDDSHVAPFLPSLETLYERCNLSKALLTSWAEAARVVLSSFSDSPIPLSIGGDQDALRLLAFPDPSAKERGSYANRPDATEMGAYATALSVVEHFYSMYAVERARELSGSDIIVSPNPESGLLEDAWRLEVSGTLGTELDVRSRFRIKCDQILLGKSELDGIVCVVGFQARLIMVERILL